MLAVIGALAPVESAELPGPLEDFAGSRPALAQTGGVVVGMEDDCPADQTDTRMWQPDPNDPSQCVLLTPPCLAAPWDAAQYLLPSTQYPEFCELSVLNSDPNYPACTVATGVVVEITGTVCRIIQVAICPSGVRVSPVTCRIVERRNWTCPQNAVPRNEFNTCYRTPTTSYVTHPACGPGAPTLLILDCATYVGDDFAQNLTLSPCSSFDPTGHPGTFQASANSYWCTYDSTLLDLDCYAPNPPCMRADALCVKRASRTGGCSVLAKSVACRALQAAFAAGSIQLEDVRAAHCEPCVILPFQPIPAGCPEDITDEPEQESRSAGRNAAFEGILREERDIRVGDSKCYRVTGGTIWPTHYPGGEPLADHANCAALASNCPNPSPGRLTWATSHFSQLAVVNSSVTVTIRDIPTNYLAFNNTYRSGNRIKTWSVSYAEYTEPDLLYPDNFIRLWDDIDPNVTYSSVVSMATSSRECILYYLPLFKLQVRELWPDNPSDLMEIDELFGTDALQWWHNIATQAERERRTNAQGWQWWPNLTAAEQLTRIDDMTQDVRCDSNNAELAWCRWQPTKPGFYKLTGFGAWVSNSSGIRGWRSPQNETSIANAVSGLTSAARTRLLNQISNWGLTPDDLGFNPTLTALIPIPASRDRNILFTTRAFQSRCPPLDIRVVCTYANSTGNYVETEPIGILVHEMRVSTVTPSS